MGDYLTHGRIRGQIDGRVLATYDAGARILFLYDRERRAAVFVAADADDVPGWMDRAPFRTILTWWAADHGLALLHGAAVATSDGAVVLAGTSGAGKSTTALACLAAGMQFIGDDACLIAPGPVPTVHSVYGLAKLEPDAARRLPGLTRFSITQGESETLVDPGSSRCRQAPLRAIFLPSVTGNSATRTVKIGAADAWRTLVPTTLLEGGGVARRSLAILGEVARGVPCFRVELGEDLDGVVDTVRGVLGSTA